MLIEFDKVFAEFELRYDLINSNVPERQSLPAVVPIILYACRFLFFSVQYYVVLCYNIDSKNKK